MNYETGQLSPEEITIVEEETRILTEVQKALTIQSIPESQQDLNDDIIELRDSLGEARTEDLPAIIAELGRLISISKQTQSANNNVPTNRLKPYFAHIQLDEGSRKRDLLIGNQNCTLDSLIHPIIDWKHAPISQIYYRYHEGEEYYEELDDRNLEGTLAVRRTVSIDDGNLYRIETRDFALVRDENGWQREDAIQSSLSGGSGVAMRPATVGKMGKGLGSKKIRKDKLLQEITALIDQDQFEIITKPESGVVVIQGGAGSGKTTIALHRLAYLVSSKPQYFAPQNVISMVFNKALARYISKVLPSLGVVGSKSWIFQEWTQNYVRRYFQDLPGQHSERTPVVAIELKRHPGMLQWLEFEVKKFEDRFSNSLKKNIPDVPGRDSVFQAWDALRTWPLAKRILMLLYWSKGREEISRVPSCNSYVLATRVKDVIYEVAPELERNITSVARTIWEECFIQLETLKNGVETFMDGAFTEAQINDVWNWAVRNYERRSATVEQSEEGTGLSEKEIDEEDDTILLLLYQMTLGAFRKKKNKKVIHPHIMVDEAQDFSPIELQLLLNTTPKTRRSVTLAGDYDQQIVVGSQITSWNEMLDTLGMDRTAISPLKIGYRSTHEIMEVAREVIGEHSVNQEWTAVRHGAPVELFRMHSDGQMLQFLSEALIDLSIREPSANVAVLTRYASQAELVYDGLAKADVPKLRRIRDQDFSFTAGVEVTNIAQVKGLEFDYVILIDVDNQTFPDEDKARHLLYVGVTRAAHQLWIMTQRAPSPLLPLKMLEAGD